MRYVKNLPAGLEFRYCTVFGAVVFYSAKSHRWYEYHEDYIVSFSAKEFHSPK